MKPNSNCFSLRPATREEASLFYSDDQTDRIIGYSGPCPDGLWLQRQGVLPYLVASQWGPVQHAGVQGGPAAVCGRRAGGWAVEGSALYGPILPAERRGHHGGRSELWVSGGDRRLPLLPPVYPQPRGSQCYLYCYDLRQQTLDRPVGRVSFANGEHMEFTAPQDYLRTIREELPTKDGTGFRFETLTDDPAVRKAVDDMVYDLYGEENPRPLADYIARHGQEMGGQQM